MSNKNKYVDLYLPNHHRARKSSGNVHEHIVVAEQMLGRRLNEKEVVHHEDEVKSNNTPENLYVFKTKSDHSRYHQTGIKIKEKDYWVSPPQKGTSGNPYILNCKKCSSEFNSIIQETMYCSERCRRLSSRLVERPSSEELYKLLEVNTFTKVARIFNVSCNAVRKWCRNYGIPDKAKYYKNK